MASYSDDGGANWTPRQIATGQVTGTESSLPAGQGDVHAAYDGYGNLYLTYITPNPTYTDGGMVQKGTSTGNNSANTFQDESRNWVDDQWASEVLDEEPKVNVAYFIKITGGSGAGQTQLITGNSSNELYLSESFTTVPAANDPYEIIAYGSLTEEEDAGSEPGYPNQLYKTTSSSWIADAYVNDYVLIIDDEKTLEQGLITGNSASSLTLEGGWSHDESLDLHPYFVILQPSRILVVANSTNNGHSFTFWETLAVGSHFPDYPSIATGPGEFQDNTGQSVWVSWMDDVWGNTASGAFVGGSGDFGTFGDPESVSNGNGEFASISVGPHGEVMLSTEASHIWVAVDEDGLGDEGFSSQVDVTSTNVGNDFQIDAQPNRNISTARWLAWDRSGEFVPPHDEDYTYLGRVYVIYTNRPDPASNPKDTDIYVRYSDDLGALLERSSCESPTTTLQF